MPVDPKILEHLKRNDPTFANLTITYSELKDADAENLALVLKENHTLRSLDLKKLNLL